MSGLADVDVMMLWSAIEAAAEQVGLAVYVARVDCVPPQILYASKRAAEIVARPQADLVGMKPWEILRPEDHAKVRELISRPVGAPPMNIKATVLRPDGVLVPIEVAAARIHAGDQILTFGYFRDVSVEQQTLAALRQWEALGTLAAGVAHEINNPLTYAQLNVQLIANSLASSGLSADALATIRDHLRAIEHGINRVASITRGLQTFARPDELPTGPVDVVPILEHALITLERDLDRVRLIRHIEPVPQVAANAPRLEQVFVNILLNAIQALPEGRQGSEIEVSTAQRGPLVSIAIRDTGRGIPPAIRDRIFDPFFTTRPIGKGVGLGLSVCKTIVQGFGGQIAIDSVENAGTTVTISLVVA